MSKSDKNTGVIKSQQKGLARFFRLCVKHKWLLVMLIPSMTYILLFSYLPLTGLVLAFKKFNARLGIWGSQWVGWTNFERIFSTPA